MTINTWDPNQQSLDNTSYTLDIFFLNKAIDFAENHLDTEIASYLTPQEQQQHAPIMKLPKETWFSLKTSLSNENIIALIRFFTLAEVQLTDWSGEEHSPVISLTKMLRQNGEKVSTELLQWIKAKNNNRFLPYGAL
jgi:hypothetical protein